MSETIAEMSEVPPVLPVAQISDEREKLLRASAQVNSTNNEISSGESENEEPEELAEIPRTSKKKLFFVFVMMVTGFMLLVLLMSWFFGIGAFAAAKPQAVDRTAKTNSGQTAPMTEEEKLKMALNLVAEKNPNANSIDISNSGGTIQSNSSVDVPATKATDLNEPVVVPDPVAKTGEDQANPAASQNNGLSGKTSVSTLSNRVESAGQAERNDGLTAPLNRETNSSPVGRSLFFGLAHKETAESKKTPVRETVPNTEPINYIAQPAPKLPFGTLLPVRLLGAVFTLRSSGGLVRMELTRSISGQNYSYPAGTILVGNLRGSERNRAFISIVGLIDPVSGGLIKFTGEVMGNDGASGVVGRTRQIKSIWSRVLGGMRDVGTAAIGALGSRRSGGTVIISDASNKASGVLSEELSGAVGNARNANEFVEVSAGATAFVLVTDLSDEKQATNLAEPDVKSATGLSESELADLFSEGNKERIRAAMPRMTPEFRKLAEKYLAQAFE